MNQFPQKSVELIINSLKKQGITNKILQIGILAVVSTECGFQPKSEMSYKKTPNSWLRALFGKRLPASDEELSNIKKDDIAFFDLIYGGRYGNDQPGDGFKYRGRGFNQITFKNLYKVYGDEIGIDLVKDPDKLNELPIAADVLAVYYKKTLKIGFKGISKKRYNVSKVEEIKDIDTATKIAFSCNTGWGKNWEQNEALLRINETQKRNALVIENQIA
jgi:predicted chitinase